MRKQLALGATLFATAVCISLVPSVRAADNKLSQNDKLFINEVSQMSLFEQKASELAQDRSKNEDIKKFASHMVEDHKDANDQLMKLAKDKGVNLNTELKGPNADKFTGLKAKQGRDFDDNYIKTMVLDHNAAVDQFKREADHGSDPDVKEWAGKMLKTMQDHQKMAKDTQKSYDHGK